MQHITLRYYAHSSMIEPHSAIKLDVLHVLSHILHILHIYAYLVIYFAYFSHILHISNHEDWVLLITPPDALKTIGPV